MPTARNRADESGFFRSPPPRILAHRGLALEAPENTLLAFAKAIATGVNYLETDVHESADGVAIISHDPTLERVAGRKVRVNQLTASELGRVDLGAGQSFTSLQHALETFPDARFNVDVKSSGAVQPTINAILAARATGRVLVTSFSDRTRRATIKGLPGVASSASMGTMIQILSASKIGMFSRVTKMFSEFAAIQVPERWGGISVVTPRLIRLAHDANVEVHVWTVNEPNDMHRLLDLGVDGLVTDRADLAVQVLLSRK